MAKPSSKKQGEMVEQEIERLNGIFLDLPDNKREVAKELIDRIAFMTIQLQILEDTIKRKGPTYVYQNGSQKMLIENPAQKSYNTTMNRYVAAYDKLFNLLDQIDKNDDEDDFEDV